LLVDVIKLAQNPAQLKEDDNADTTLYPSGFSAAALVNVIEQAKVWAK
jgi:hypothetical protein